MISEKRRSHSKLWALVRIETKTVTRTLDFGESKEAVVLRITATSTSFSYRRKQGVVDKQTCFEISATANVACSCSRRRIFRSRRSISSSHRSLLRSSYRVRG